MLIENIKGETVNPIRIKALFHAYGMHYPDIVRFYCNEDASLILCAQGNIATVYAENRAVLQEAVPFLTMQFGEILTEYPIDISDYQLEIGMMYAKPKSAFQGRTLSLISNQIQESYNVLEQVFPAINADVHMAWYTDTSHRIRHGVSKIYTYEKQCTATAYGVIDGVMLLTQLATLPSARGKGMANTLLSHCMIDCGAEKMILHSGNKTSDLFYEHNGFSPMGKWYYYIYDESHWIV